MPERPARWDPMPLPSSGVFIERITDRDGTLSLWMREPGGSEVRWRVVFEKPLLYVVRDESYLLVPPGGAEAYDPGHSFYTIDGSSLLERFHEESSGVYARWDIKHFAVYTDTDCVDVLSPTEPRLEPVDDHRPGTSTDE